jgi:hypothetical protein
MRAEIVLIAAIRIKYRNADNRDHVNSFTMHYDPIRDRMAPFESGFFQYT